MWEVGSEGEVRAATMPCGPEGGAQSSGLGSEVREGGTTRRAACCGWDAPLSVPPNPQPHLCEIIPITREETEAKRGHRPNSKVGVLSSTQAASLKARS